MYALALMGDLEAANLYWKQLNSEKPSQGNFFRLIGALTNRQSQRYCISLVQHWPTFMIGSIMVINGVPKYIWLYKWLSVWNIKKRSVLLSLVISNGYGEGGMAGGVTCSAKNQI